MQQETLCKETQTKNLKKIQARIVALVRGIQTQPENVLDYGEALEVQVLLLNQVIHNLSEKE